MKQQEEAPISARSKSSLTFEPDPAGPAKSRHAMTLRPHAKRPGMYDRDTVEVKSVCGNPVRPCNGFKSRLLPTDSVLGKSPNGRQMIITTDRITTIKKQEIERKLAASRHGKRLRFEKADSPQSDGTSGSFLLAPKLIIQTETSGIIKQRTVMLTAELDFNEATLREAIMSASCRKKKSHKANPVVPATKDPDTPSKQPARARIRKRHARRYKKRGRVTSTFGNSRAYHFKKRGFTNEFQQLLLKHHDELVKAIADYDVESEIVEQFINHKEVKACVASYESCKDDFVSEQVFRFLVLRNLVQSHEVLHQIAHSLRKNDKDLFCGSRIDNTAMIPAEYVGKILNRDHHLEVETKVTFADDKEPGRDGHRCYLHRGDIEMSYHIIGTPLTFIFKLPGGNLLKPVFPVGFSFELFKTFVEVYTGALDDTDKEDDRMQFEPIFAQVSQAGKEEGASLSSPLSSQESSSSQHSQSSGSQLPQPRFD